MDGHGDDGLQDLFPHSDPAFPAGAFDLLSQAESSGVPALDLNYQAEDLADYSSYSDLLRGEGAPRGRGSRTLGLRAPRNGGRGGGGGSRAGGGGRGGGRGGGGSGGRRGAPVTRPLFIGSLADGAGSSGGRSGGRSYGRARRSRGRGGPSTADYTEPYGGEDWVDLDDEEGGPQNVELNFPTSKINRFDKAQWTEHNTGLLCDLWVEQIRSGNCPKGSITSRGLKTVVDKYQMATRLRHQNSQIRNRINQLKTLHNFWKASQKDTGLGRNADGSISAAEWWWKKNTKGKFSECKKFRYGVPNYMNHLEEMFHDVVVDGSTSFVAGCEEDEDQDADDVEQDDQYGPDGFVNEYEDSPVSNSSRKRGSSTSTKSTATSPGKKSKSPLMKMVSSLVEKLTTSDKDDNLLRNVGESIATSLNEKRQKLNPIQEMGQSVKRCQQLALECGATPESVEFYAGRHLFKDPYEREFFCNIPTPEGRLRHLQRYCKENNIVE